jgi:SEC-C motif
VLLIQNNQPAPRFAHEGCGVHRAAAMRTAPAPGGRRKIAIEGEQKVIKPGIAQQLSVQGSLLPVEVAEMAKIGRNDRCPCGSGKKYKQCCLAKDATARAAAPPPVPSHRAALANLAALADLALADDEDDELTTASNAVIDLVKAGQLDEAERAAHDLLERFPQVHDGYDRLGMVYEARGDNRRAAECYRKVIAFVREHPEIYEPGFDDTFRRLVDRLDPAPGSPTDGLP